MALRPTNPNSPAATDKKAERQAASEDVLLREVDDAVRQDQYANFASTYGKPLIGALVLGLAAFGGYLYWEKQNEADLEARSETLVGALDQVEAGNLDTGSTTLDPLLADKEAGIRTAAKMLKAGIAMEQGKTQQAAALFAAVSADGDAPQVMRDLATIREIAATYDSRKPANVIAKLKPFAVPGHAFFGSAGEMVAMAYLEQGKRAEAGTLFAAIAKDEKVPDGLRSRSRQMAGLLGVDAIEDVDKVLEELAVPGNEAAEAAE